MTTRLPLTAAALLAALALTACEATPIADATAQDQAPPAAEPTATSEDPTSASEDPAAASHNPAAPTTGEVLGQVMVDGISYDITQLRNCDPLSTGPVERELELQGLGEHEGQRLQIDVYVQTLAGSPFNDVSWAGPEGVFGGADGAEAVVSDNGTRVSGQAELVDALNQTDSVAVVFDLPIPTETVACR